ncbi:hypothetical protein PSEWESI4_01174 [Pseudomonas carbonaria]|uniref:Uncharacterized protein n=1 Tax=Zestomonas carbonaria TaxID=2762745 RepID=A0A7U7EL75_9GAMM|nr:hypothetical protein PSEWESI4_01174 [Pseudomonas carbonaria]
MGLREQPQASSDTLQALRRWLFWLCQSRAGQCLQQNPRPKQNL